MSTKRIRNRRTGYALITVLVLGLLAMSFLLAVAQLAYSSLESEAHRRYGIELRNAAEAGVDYSISQLNSAAAANQPCPIDDGQPHQIASSYMAASLGTPVASNQSSLNNLTTTVTLTKISPPNTWSDIKGWSSIYSPSLDFTNSTSTTWKQPPTSNLTVDSWRILTVTAQYPMLSKNIRVILEPRYPPPPTSKNPGNADYFSNILFGNQGLSFQPSGLLTVQGVGAPGTSSYNPAIPTSATQSLPQSEQVYTYQLNVSSNEIASVGSNTDLRGNLQVSSTNSGPNAVVNFPTVPSGIIEGMVTGNGIFSGVQTNPGNAIVPTSNVYGDADLYNPGTNPAGNPSQPLSTNRVGQNQSPGVPGSSLSQTLPAPAMSVPSDAQSLPNLTNIPTPLPAGDYVSTGFDTTGFSTPVTVGTSTGTTPTRIFVQDGGSSANAINLNSNQFMNASADAGNLQFWYAGANPIFINLAGGKSFVGLIYAPNATVNITGTGTFEGGVVAGVLNANHQGNLNLRTDLSTPSTATASQGLTYNSNSNVPVVLFVPVTWEEPYGL